MLCESQETFGKVEAVHCRGADTGILLLTHEVFRAKKDFDPSIAIRTPLTHLRALDEHCTLCLLSCGYYIGLAGSHCRHKGASTRYSRLQGQKAELHVSAHGGNMPQLSSATSPMSTSVSTRPSFVYYTEYLLTALQVPSDMLIMER